MPLWYHFPGDDVENVPVFGVAVRGPAVPLAFVARERLQVLQELLDLLLRMEGHGGIGAPLILRAEELAAEDAARRERSLELREDGVERLWRIERQGVHRAHDVILRCRELVRVEGRDDGMQFLGTDRFGHSDQRLLAIDRGHVETLREQEFRILERAGAEIQGLALVPDVAQRLYEQ